MDLNLWLPKYREITKELKTDPVNDQRATDLLSVLLRKKAIFLVELVELVKDRPVLILGGGPSVERDLTKLVRNDALDVFVTVAADGATTALMDASSKQPDLIVTDLDGRLPDILTCNIKSSHVAVHSHGENMSRLATYVSRLTRIIGVTSVEPRPDVYNFGGYTDGDMAVFLAAELGASHVVLAGMDMGSVLGRYSRPVQHNLEAQQARVRICKELLEWYADRAHAELFNLTCQGEPVKGFRQLNPNQVKETIRSEAVAKQRYL